MRATAAPDRVRKHRTEDDMMKCPICRKPADPEFKPFCSRRCADLDLGKWMNDSYAIPGEPADVAEENPPSGEDR